MPTKDNTHKRKKYSFTLLEILIALSIMASMAAFFGHKTYRVIQENRFYSEAEQLLEFLSLAQDAMLLLDQDILVKINAEKKGLIFSYKVENIPSKKWLPILSQKKEFSAIHSISFISKELSTNEITLKFCDHGTLMSQGDLILTSHSFLGAKESLKKVISLKGYVAPLRLSNSQKNDVENDKLNKLTERLMSEISHA